MRPHFANSGTFSRDLDLALAADDLVALVAAIRTAVTVRTAIELEVG
jgi:hypothetical protein